MLCSALINVQLTRHSNLKGLLRNIVPRCINLVGIDKLIHRLALTFLLDFLSCCPIEGSHICFSGWRCPSLQPTIAGKRLTLPSALRHLPSWEAPHISSRAQMAATPPSSRSPAPAGASGAVVYRMHVSQKYLDLTKKKLDLTRLPRDSHSSRYSGISKADLGRLVDHWTEEYSWRAQENFFNDTLPQYRTPIHGTRIHFAHRRSMSAIASPLLFIHGWPDTFIAVSNMIDALCDPVRTPPRGDEDSPAFHVVAPSIPGFGFSDQVSEDGNNLVATAEIFDALMQSLGYNRYLLHGSGW